MPKLATNDRRPALEKIFVDIGKRIRWIREAFEAREPLMHSQSQWAKWLGIKKEMMNRIELGRIPIPLDVVGEIGIRTGVGTDFIFYGALIEDRFLPDQHWLYRSLLLAHGPELLLQAQWDQTRAAALAMSHSIEERPPTKLRRVYRPRKKARQGDGPENSA